MPLGRLALIENDIVELVEVANFLTNRSLSVRHLHIENRASKAIQPGRGLQSIREEGLQSLEQYCHAPRFLSNLRALHRPCLRHRRKETANHDPMHRERHV